MKINKDQNLAIFYVILGGVLLVLSQNIQSLFSMSENDVGPRFFPSLCAIGIILCGIGKFITSRHNESKPFLKDKKDYLRLVFIWLFLVAYVFAVKYLGYIISSLIFVYVLTGMLASPRKLKWWQRLIFTVVMVGFTYLLFHVAIKVQLPQGKWIKALKRALR